MKIKHHIHRHIGTHHVDTWWKLLLVLAILIAGFFCFLYLKQAYPQFFATKISVGQAEDISPKSPVEIDFSLPVWQKYYADQVSVSPATGFKLRWENANAKVFLIPEGFWQPDTRYEITLPTGRNMMFADVAAQKIYFYTERYPEVKSAFPLPGQRDVSVDIEEPIKIELSKSPEDFFLKFTLDGKENFSVQPDSSRKVFYLLPKTNLDYLTSYNLVIYAKYKNDAADSFKEIYAADFVTAGPPQIAWEKDYSARLAQARRYTRAKIKTGKYIDINLGAQILSIFEDGKMLDDYMISSGKSGMPTPSGMTQIYNKTPRAYSSAYGLYMPYWMALAASGRFGIHELPEWPNGYKEGAAHLGIPVSHGCVRLGVGAAKRVYNWASIGTKVVIY